MKLTRREWTQMALSAVPWAAWGADAKTNGVMLGAQSYSFRDRSLDDAIKAMQEIGIGYTELWQGHVEPKMKRDELKMWRTTVGMDHFMKVRAKFHSAGIVLYAYNYSFREDFSDQEIERGFEMAKALGVKCLTASSNVTTAARIDPFANKAKIPVGMHNHSRIAKNEFATPDDFAEAMKGKSKYIAINLDIGHFTAANFDAVDFLEKNHQHIVTIHIKDRKKDQGDNMPLGEGDTPIKQVLQVLKTRKYPIPAMIEYEYKGIEPVSEVKKCIEYCKSALAG
jgi:sugar phosphate isomerase/epimerase